jgi:hypothetical protein
MEDLASMMALASTSDGFVWLFSLSGFLHGPWACGVVRRMDDDQSSSFGVVNHLGLFSV